MGQSSVAALVPESVRATVTKASDDCALAETAGRVLGFDWVSASSVAKWLP